ncbi:MAG: hypothetical protein Kow0069_36310 [Promethearchaeota archaeon]
MQAEAILRDPSNFQWHVVPLLLFAIYVYSVEIEKRNWNVVLAGLAFWGCDWFNEIWNGLVYHFTGYAPAWGAPGGTAYLILIGLNVEISLMFAVMGVVSVKLLAGREKDEKVLGVPNRLFTALLGAFLCLLVELILNAAGVLTWDWPWWNARAPWLIYVVGYLYFFLTAYWVYDMRSRRKQVLVTCAILAVDAACLAVFVPLGWI